MSKGFEFGSAERRNGAARSALKSSATDVLDDLEELRDDAVRLAEAARRAARAEVEAATARVTRLRRQVRDRARGEVRHLSQNVREKPTQALALAIGIGILIGIAWKR